MIAIGIKRTWQKTNLAYGVCLPIIKTAKFEGNRALDGKLGDWYGRKWARYRVGAFSVCKARFKLPQETTEAPIPTCDIGPQTS